MIVRKLAPFVALVLVLAAVPATAQPVPNTNFTFSAGWFPTSFSTSARLSTAEILGSDIDLEDDLGFDTSASNFRLEGFWRFKPRHSFEASYTSWRRSADKTLEGDIDWGENHFDVGARIHATNNAQFIKLAYRYSIMKSDTSEVALSAGLDTVWNHSVLEGEGTISGSGTGTQQLSEEYDFVAPVPVFGVAASHLTGSKWLLRGSVEYLQLTISDTTGKVLDFRGSVDYLYSQNYGVGLGYNWVGLKIERERFDAQYDFSGPLLYFTYRR